MRSAPGLQWIRHMLFFAPVRKRLSSIESHSPVVHHGIVAFSRVLRVSHEGRPATASASVEEAATFRVRLVLGTDDLHPRWVGSSLRTQKNRHRSKYYGMPLCVIGWETNITLH